MTSFIKEKGLIFKLVKSAKKWFPDETARYYFYLDLIKEIECEGWELCRPDAVEIDFVFKEALNHTHPELK